MHTKHTWTRRHDGRFDLGGHLPLSFRPKGACLSSCTTSTCVTCRLPFRQGRASSLTKWCHSLTLRTVRRYGTTTHLHARSAISPSPQRPLRRRARLPPHADARRRGTRDGCQGLEAIARLLKPPAHRRGGKLSAGPRGLLEAVGLRRLYGWRRLPAPTGASPPSLAHPGHDGSSRPNRPSLACGRAERSRRRARSLSPPSRQVFEAIKAFSEKKKLPVEANFIKARASRPPGSDSDRQTDF